jgi:hypothetical protein
MLRWQLGKTIKAGNPFDAAGLFFAPATPETQDCNTHNTDEGCG